MSPIPEVDAHWARLFDSPPAEVWRAGVAVTPHRGHLLGYRGLFFFKRRDACRISAPPSMVEPLRRRVEQLDAATVFRGEMLREALGDQVELIIGPNWYGYVDCAAYRAVPTANCRAIQDSDASAVVGLRDACPDSDWQEASFDQAAPVFGCFDASGELVAASNLTGWRKGRDGIGVVTRPDRRGHGYGTAVASAATAAALETTTVAEWRARGTNTASIRTALRLGFVHYGENLAVRLH